VIETLVVVHLSSIDSYVQFYGFYPAQLFINDLRFAIITHAGPVVVMDQDWTEISDEAQQLREMVLDLKKFHHNFAVFHHDELCDVSPWQDGMKALAKVLRGLGTQRVRIAGLWASQDGSSGCVHEVQRQLRSRNIPCYVDAKLCAFEENDVRVRR
jgi:hypothetical protein